MPISQALSGANLSESDLSSSIIIGYKGYQHNLKCDNAKFKRAIIDNVDFQVYLRKNNAGNIPPAVKSKEELQKELELRAFGKQQIEMLLNISSLSDIRTTE